MADKTIGELPSIAGLYADSLIPVEQQGVASKMTGKQFADFARESAAQDVQRAVDAADAAEKSAAGAKEEADRAADLRESIEVDYEALRQAVKDAEGHADRAEAEAKRSGDSAALSESWAVGGTGTRQGEDENNAKYWADRAQAEAERASVPPVEGVYNIVLEDRITGDRYALIIERGRLALLGVSDALEATSPLIIDQTDGKAYSVIVEDGRLAVEESA